MVISLLLIVVLREHRGASRERGMTGWLVECRGPAPVDPGNSKVGMASVSLEKYIFNYRDIERLEMDSVVGKLVEKKRLNNLVYVE